MGQARPYSVAACGVVQAKRKVKRRLVYGQEVNTAIVVTSNELLGDKASLFGQVALTENHNGHAIDSPNHEPIDKPLEHFWLEHFLPRHATFSLQYLL